MMTPRAAWLRILSDAVRALTPPPGPNNRAARRARVRVPRDVGFQTYAQRLAAARSAMQER